MNFFEQELRRIADACGGVINPTFAGRACYADLGGDNRVKLEFVTQGTHEQYEALKATILNRSEGAVDSLLFRFSDVWGKKHDRGYNGGIPHIWTNDRKTEWYFYKPTDADMKKLATEVGAYIGVFADRSIVPEKAQGKPKTNEKDSVIKEIRESKPKATTRKTSQVRNKSEADL